MSETDLEALRAYCDAIARPLSGKPEYGELAAGVRQGYLEPIGLGAATLPVAVTESEEHHASYVADRGNRWSGIIVDERYLLSLFGLLEALVEGENSVGVARPFIDIVAHELALAGAGTEALALRNERLSALYVIENAYTGLRRLLDCDEFLQLAERIQEKPRPGLFGQVFYYIVLHESAHWLYNTFADERAIRGNREQIDALARRLLNVSWAAEPGRAAESEVTLGERLGPSIARSMTEEIFCDRVVCGAFLVRTALDGSNWRDAYVLLRLIQEANRLLHQALGVAADFLSGQRFLQTYPTLEANVAARGLDPLHARAWLATAGFQDYLEVIYETFVVDGRFEEEAVDAALEALADQALTVFTQLGGSELDRCVFLCLRSVRAKLADEHVRAFFETLAKRRDILTNGDLREAFAAAIAQAADAAIDSELMSPYDEQPP